MEGKVRFELQFIYVLFLIGPSFARFHHERSRLLTDVRTFPTFEIIASILNFILFKVVKKCYNDFHSLIRLFYR